MNKIEEIINNYDILEFGGINQRYIKNQIVQAMSEFGKICFEAGRTVGNINSIANFYKYQEYEEFLKEIENEEGN